MQQVTKKPFFRALAMAAVLAVFTAVASLSMARAKEPLPRTGFGPGACTRCYCDHFQYGGGNACTRWSCRHQWGDHKN
jgi:hypothetical protein